MEVRDAIIFTAGFLAGTVATYFAVKERFESFANEEIAAMKDYYTEKEKKKEKKAAKKAEIKNDPAEFKEYKSNAERVGYDKIPKHEEVKDMKETDVATPYVISSEEFEMDADYEKESLIYYAGNDYLVNEDEDEAYEISIYIGREALDHFGDEVEDTVYVRNERLRTDYEIHREESEYIDMNV